MIQIYSCCIAPKTKKLCDASVGWLFLVFISVLWVFGFVHFNSVSSRESTRNTEWSCQVVLLKESPTNMKPQSKDLAKPCKYVFAISQHVGLINFNSVFSGLYDTQIIVIGSHNPKTPLFPIFNSHLIQNCHFQIESWQI